MKTSTVNTLICNAVSSWKRRIQNTHLKKYDYFLYRDMALIFLMVVFLGSLFVYFSFRYQEMQFLTRLKTLQTARELENFIRSVNSAKLRELATFKLTEILMADKNFEKARIYQKVLRETASSKELRFRAACDYAISFSFSGKYHEALQALQQIETYSGVIPEEKRYGLLLMLAIESFRCQKNSDAWKYLQELCALPASPNPKNEEAREKARKMLELSGRRKNK